LVVQFYFIMELKEIVIQLAEFSELSYFAIAIFCLMNFQKQRYLFFYSLIYAALLVLSNQLADRGIFNWWIYNLLAVTDFLFVFFVYNHAQTQKIKWFWAVLVLVIFTGFFLYDFIPLWQCHRGNLSESLRFINCYGLALSQAWILALGINYLFQLYRTKAVLRITQHGFFFINAGFMISASAHLFIYLWSARIASVDFEDIFFYDCWIMLSIFVLIRMFFVVFGLFIERKYAR